MDPLAGYRRPPSEAATAIEIGDDLPTTARRGKAARRGRHAHELVAAGTDTEVTQLRVKLARTEATLADQRRDTARAIRGLRAEVAFWRLRAQGVPAPEAAMRAGLSTEPGA
jgi:hypothetical protein